MRKSQTSTCPISEDRYQAILCSNLRCPHPVKHPLSHSTTTIPSHPLPNRSSHHGQHPRCHRMACRYMIQMQATWIPSSARLSSLPLAIHSGTRSFRMVNHLRLTTSTLSESLCCMPANPLLRVMGSWNLICGPPRPLPRATAFPTPAVVTWETHSVAPQICAHS